MLVDEERGLRGFLARRRFEIGVVFLVAALGASILLAVLASSDKPPGGALSALLVVIGAGFNVGGAWAVSASTPTNVGAVRMAARHLGEAALSVAAARKLAEEAFDDRTALVLREAMGQLSVRLSEIEQKLGSNLEDWSDAHPRILTFAETDKNSNDSTEQS